MSAARGPNWPIARSTSPADLARPGRRTGRRSCPGTARRGRCTRSRPRSPGWPYTSRRPERPGPQRQLEEDEDDRPDEHRAHAGRMNRGRRRMPGSTASTYSPTGRASSRVSEWLPTDSPKTTVAASSQRSGRLVGRGRRPARRASSQPTSRRSRIASRARWRACASARVPIDQTSGVRASPRPASTPRAVDRVRVRAEVRRDRRRDGHATDRRRGSSGRPARRTASSRRLASQPSRT